MPKTALILFAHGSRDAQWAAPLKRVQGALRARSPGLRVELAFLEFLAPDLNDCAQSLIDEGFAQIVVLPMFIAQGGHLKNDLPLLLDGLRTRYPQASFALRAPVGEAEIVVQAMVEQALGEVAAVGAVSAG